MWPRTTERRGMVGSVVACLPPRVPRPPNRRSILKTSTSSRRPPKGTLLGKRSSSSQTEGSVTAIATCPPRWAVISGAKARADPSPSEQRETSKATECVRVLKDRPHRLWMAPCSRSSGFMYINGSNSLAYLAQFDAMRASASTNAMTISPEARRSAGGVSSPKRSGCRSLTSFRRARLASRPPAPSGRSSRTWADACRRTC